MMTKDHWLCHLQMSETRHHRIRMLFREIQQRMLHGMDEADNVVNRSAQIKPDIGRHLIVA